MKKIFIIEDDIWIAGSLKLYLENSDFKVEVYNTGEWASEKILSTDIDLVILDINLPKKDGIEICREVRKESSIPIIMLTAKTWEWDKIAGFDVWADDYIAKPFSPRELLARIQSILRRAKNEKEENNENIIRYKKIEIHLEKNIAFLEGNEISFTKNEFDIFKKILSEDGRLVSREILMTEVIGYDKYMYDRTIDTHIKNIRRKIQDKNAIITIRGKWYRLNK